MSELSTHLNTSFDVANEEGTPAFAPIPKGTYVAFISDAKAGILKSGRGRAINVTWTIEGGAHNGRLIFDRVIVEHESADAMKFGRMRLKDICVACGWKQKLDDLTVLLNKPCSIYVKIEHDKDGEYPPKNRVGRVQPIPAVVKPAEAPFNDEVPF